MDVIHARVGMCEHVCTSPPPLPHTHIYIFFKIFFRNNIST